jgi:hypothetical protein
VIYIASFFILNLSQNIYNRKTIIMNKIEEIFTSWRISFDPNQEQADLAKERIQICEGCEHKENVTLGSFDIFTRCNLCGCALRGKIFTPVLNACPDGRWSEIEEKWLEKNNDEQV